MKKILLTLISVFAISFVSADNNSVEGMWKTIDDETGEAKSLVKIWIDDGELKAQITELLNPSEPNPVCNECKGSLKNQPIEGMVFVWGLEKDGNEWTGGKIVDPNNGKEYKAKVELIEDGAKLSVRGFIGFALIGRTQVWERI
ncbi:DUF2147 domain-containing protein [Reinekea sp.]|jgi:uncharacterized protein (DUF2147 family)|uniref:DUF2147 domain-containing protein n=1 Tax=Reinekea sp. TaxID=1970455 RepID=UPI003989143D